MTKFFLITLCVLLAAFTSAQEVDDKTFDHHLTVLDSLSEYHITDLDHQYVDRLIASGTLSAEQSNHLSIYSGRKLAYDRKDSLALLRLENGKKMLISFDDNSSLAYATLLQGQAHLTKNEDQNEEALALYEAAHKILVGKYDKQHPKVGRSLLYLGEIIFAMGEYGKAENFINEAIKNLENSLGKQHPKYAKALNVSGKLYINLGKYGEAETRLKECMDIQDNLFGKEHPNYLSSLTSMGVLTNIKGQYEEAEAILVEAKALGEKIYGKGHLDGADCIRTLGNVYLDIGEYDKGEPLLLEYNEIIKKELGEENAKYAAGLYGLAVLYYYTQEFDKAIDYCSQSKDIRGRILGVNHPYYSANVTFLAVMYRITGENEKAETYYLESKGILENTVGKEHRDYALCLHGLADFYFSVGKKDKAWEYALKSQETRIKLLTLSQDYLSEKELQQYQSNVLGTLDFLKAMGLNYKPETVNEEIFNTLLYQKGIFLRASIQTKKFILSQEDASLNKTYDDLIATQKLLGREFQLPVSQRGQVDSLEQKITLLEKDLAKASSTFRQENQNNNVVTADIKSILKSDEAVVEFTHFDAEMDWNKDSIVYAASVLSPDGSIHFIPLCSETELSEKVSLINNNSQSINNLYGAETRGVSEVKEEQRSLYEMIWQPLDSLLKGTKKIYYSPSGLLNRLNINAVAIDEMTSLADQYEMVTLFSTRSIAVPQEVNSNTTAYILGDIVYDLPEEIAGVEPEAESVAEELGTTARSQRSGSWKALRWTNNECSKISEKLMASAHKVTYRSKLEATEDNFKQLGVKSKSPKVIHLATHGYFLSDDEDEDTESSLSGHPLMRSGLILAGGNHAWKENKPIPGKEDGILTAYEISNMNFSNTELVVLSACETGLGEIRGSEGVYGLQRAFKMAGAKYLIMSLWQVPDRATSAFMIQFYENYLDKKMPIREAFNTTQLQMRDRIFDPYSWAGFVLIE